MHKPKHIRIRGERKSEPDLRKLSRALIALAQAEAEKEAQAEQASRAQDKDQERPEDGKADQGSPRRPA